MSTKESKGKVAKTAKNDTKTTEAVSVSPSNEPPADARVVDQQNKQIAELKALVSDLGERVSAVQAVNARDAVFKSAVRSVETAAASLQAGLVSSNAPSERGYELRPGTEPERECGCGPCECVSSACCTFEVWMSHVRVDQMQIEPQDSNVLPTSVLEVWMFASIDPVNNIGVCIPDPSPLSYLPLHKQITDPFGPWVNVNRLAGTATVKRGVPLQTEIMLSVTERDPPPREALAVRPEWGSATEKLTLDCCYSNYSPIQLSVPLTSWGQGGGAVTGRFLVVKRC